MRLKRFRQSGRSAAAAIADETEDSNDTTSVEATSEEDDRGQDLPRRRTDVRKNAAQKPVGLYAEDSVQDSVVKSSSEEDETEYQVQDNNDECCSNCGTKKDSDKLLCCELCPAVYHLYCLKPPLKRIPAGDWFCTHCRSILGLENVEKFLAVRTRMVDLEAERVAEEAAAQQQLEPAQANKRKAPVGTVPLAAKKRKMASVQQLHTAEPTADPAKAEQRSRSVSRSCSETSGKHPRAGSNSAQADSPRKQQASIETSAEGLNTYGAASGSGIQATQPATGSELQHPGVDASALPANAKPRLDTAARQSHAPGQSGAHAAGRLTSVKEYFVKWKGKSHLHCSWIRHDDVLKVARRSAGLNMRFRNYQRSVYGMPQKASSGKLEDQEVGDLVNGIDPLWVLVDRIVARQEQQGSGVQYLVKWRGLGYDECTWESPHDLVPKFKPEVAKYESQHPIANELIERHKSRFQASTSQAEAIRSAAGRKIGTRKFSDSPSFLQGGGSLHPYQLEGLNWLYFAWEQRKHVILADEMGLGKTIQSIAFLAALKEEEQVQRPHLVVVPLSTFPNWEREFALWAPQLNVVPFIGNQAGRNVVKQHELYADPSLIKGKAKSHSKHAELQARVKFHVLLTTYEMVSFEAGILRSLEYETLIVDEGHRLKNQQSKLFQLLHNFKTRQRTLLTGTPLQNNLSELWMLLHFLDAGKFQSLEEFQADFSDLSHGDQIGKLHELLSPHLLRRLKKDVLKQLPPKKEQIVRVELAPLQKDWYRGILTRNFPNLTNGKQTGRLKSVMMELRKCCNHPFLIDGQEWPTTRDPDQFLQQLVQASGKLALVDSMLARMKDRGHRVLIYSQFTTLLDLLEDWLAARKWGYQRIDGSVSGAERQSRIDQFNKRPADNFVFLLSTRAGGLGINLASADTVIIYDSDWNPHNDLQAQARAHRLGQLKPVMIYRLVTRLTIEERMMQQTKKKMVLEHLVVHKMNTAADLKQDELDDILRYGAAELFADAVAASQQAEQVAGTSTDQGKADEGAEEQGGEAGGAAGPVNKAAAEKADKLVRLSEREQAEGRTGGQAGQRIVYDDAAIDRLLDRSEHGNADAEQADEKEDDLVKGFKVANFEIIDSPDKGVGAAQEEAVLEAQPSAPMQAGAAFWEELLKAGYQDLQQAQMEALGKGKRERRQVNYDEKTGKGKDDASDYSAQSDESGEESGEENMPASKKRKSEGTALSEAEARAVQPIVQQRQAAYGSSTTPLTSGSNHNLRVLGLTAAQRGLFMKALMQFGLGQQTSGGKFDWTHVHRHMTGRWPALALGQTTKYAELVMAQLSEPATDKPYFTDGISKKDILQHYELNKVLDRLGTLHLVRHTLTQQMPQPDVGFNLGPAHGPMSRHLKVWQLQHDKKLLFGVLKHGWDQWLLILKDPLLGLEPLVRQELYLTPTQPYQPPSVRSDTSAPPKVTSQAAPVDLTPPCLDGPNTSAAADLSAAPAGAVPGSIDKPASATEPGRSSAPSTAEGGPDGAPGQAASQPDSMPASDGTGQSSHQGIQLEPLTSAQPAVADAPVADAPAAAAAADEPVADVKDKLQEQPDVKVEAHKPASADTLLASAVSASVLEGPSNSAKLEPGAAAVSVSDMEATTTDVKLGPGAAAESKCQQPADAAVEKRGESASATQPRTLVAQPSPPADVVDLTAAETPSTSSAGAGSGLAATPTHAALPASGTRAAATSTAGEPRLAQPPSVAAAVSTAGPSSQPPVVLGCPKCRWAPKGCSACRGKWQAAGNALPPTLTVGGNGNADTGAAAAARAERTITTRLCNWLSNRTTVLAGILKGTHKVNPTTAAPPQPRMTATLPTPRLILPKQAGTVITTNSSGPRPTVVTGGNMQIAVGAPAYPGQWQQNAVQMSHFRQQQRQLQQQQLAAAQEQQQQNLVLQQQQRQHHTSLLRQQHQSAQLQQQQQQAAKVQAAQAHALQQQQVRMRQQQQQQGLRQQQLNQQNQLQLQRQQQLLLQQQRQRSSQQQVQRVLTSQGLQPSTSLQPPAAVAYVSAAQHAHQQQQKLTASKAQISHPLSQPDKAGAPLLMSLHKQQAARPGSPSRPYSPSLPHQHGTPYVHSRLSPFGLPQQQNAPYSLGQQLPRQQPLHQLGPSQQQHLQATGQLQQQTAAGSRPASQQNVLSPFDSKFQALPEGERVKVLHRFLRAVKPNLQPLEAPQPQAHTSPESLQEKRELVAVYNDLCSALLDVQVTLSQNRPQSMTGQDRNAAAARFQSSMQEMYGQCEQMMQTLVSRQAQSITHMQMQMGAKPQLQPVLARHGSQSIARSQSPLASKASASPRQASVMQPSSPTSPGPSSTSTGMHGGRASAPSAGASASASVRAASGTPGLAQAPSGASLTANIAGPGDASTTSSGALPGSGSLASKALSTSPRVAGTRSNAIMQASQLPGSTAANSQPAESSVAQHPVSLSSSPPRTLVPIDLTAESDDNSN